MGGYRARDADRDRYVDVIQTAYVDGQLGEADRELRVSRALVAETLDELDLLTRDLQNQPAPVVVQPPAPRVVVPEQGPLPEPVPWPVQPRRRSEKAFLGWAAAGIVVMAIVGLAMAPSDEPQSIFSSPGYPDSFVTSSPYSDVDPGFSLTAGDVRAAVAAYEARFGTNEAYRLDLHPRRVVAQVPVDGTRSRFEWWTYDGAWTRTGVVTVIQGQRQRVDLGSLSARRLVENIRTARKAVGVERGRLDRAVLTSRNGEPVVEIHITNDFNESGLVTTTPDGEIIGRTTYGA